MESRHEIVRAELLLNMHPIIRTRATGHLNNG